MSTEVTESSNRSTLHVAVGLGVFGAAHFVFLALAGRDLGPAGTAPVSVAWTLLNAIGIGLFQPVEQEIARRLSAARADGAASGQVTRVLRYVGLAILTVVALALVGYQWLADGPLASGSMVLVVVLGLGAQAFAYYARGILAGTGQFRRYGAQLAVDGGLRIILSLALFVTGASSQVAYATILVIAPLVATLITVRPTTLIRPLRARPLAETTESPLGGLVAAALSSQLLANMGPIAMAVLAGASQQDLSGRFIAAVTIARIPLFLFTPVQVVVLPALAAIVVRHDWPAYRATMRKTLLISAALATVGTLGVAVLGPWALSVAYGPAFTIGTSTLVLIAVSGGLFMLAQAYAQSLIAHHRERLIAIGWGIGLVIACATLAVDIELSLRVALALCTGTGAALVTLLLGERKIVRMWRDESPVPPQR
ncbi:lipopolysaccharide biosynthesis protein [Oerskovia sp. Root918]|uniref:lipopolysaccharide biosynthesis protein n=1 Tax=Oerskovia sp. Root918 TaxID=1736607 RepID=UPI000A512F6A|nr:hypothetical protein [Oerskovia sp. Root918]